MFGYGWHRVHVRFGNVFDDYWDIVVPSTYRFIVGGGYETTILIDESNSVDGSEMLIISLDDLVGSQIVLHVSPAHDTDSLTYLDDLLILHTSHEDILLISVGMILDDIRDFTIREYLNTFSSLCIPLFDITIVRCGQEFGSGIIKVDIFDGLRMSKEST